METALAAAGRFLQETGIEPGSIDFDAVLERFHREMEAGLQGGESSLAMIPTYIAAEGEVPLETPVLVLDAGGTNFRVAALRFDREGTPQFDGFRKNPMPGSQGREVGKEEFFDLLAADIGDLHKTSSSVGFCFSYPTQIYPDKDGRLLHFSKEILAPEVEGAYVGRGLLEALERNGIRGEKRIVVLNDTVATLLAAKSTGGEIEYSTYIGFILGTGLNCAYIESNDRIGTIPESRRGPGSQVVNMESGGFNGYTGGPVDDEFDRTTKSPGVYRFEKMVSGAYLGPLGGTVLKAAAREGLFSEKTARAFAEMETPDTVAMDRFLHLPQNRNTLIGGICASEEDRAVCYRLLDSVVERAGKLAAVNISAAVMRTGAGIDPAVPAAVCADGTTFYRTHRLRFYTRYYLKTHLEDRQGRSLRILHRDNAPLVGAAVAGLLNS
jgi:hexokinase